MLAKGFCATADFLLLQLETLRDRSKIFAMIDIAIHGIRSIEIGDITNLPNTQSYARTIWIKGVDLDGNAVSARIPLFSKTKESLVLQQERALLSQRLDEIIQCVSEVE